MIAVWSTSLSQSSPTLSLKRDVSRASPRIECCKVSGSSSRRNDRVLLWRPPAMYLNDENLDRETYLLFAIYSQACRLARDPNPTAKSYLQTFGKEIRATAHVLEWLGLVTLDKTSAFGCRPTDLLMWVIARKPNGPMKAKKRDPSVQDEDAIDSIVDAALRHEPFSTRDTGCHLAPPRPP
jgi:hypothetical protein